MLPDANENLALQLYSKAYQAYKMKHVGSFCVDGPGINKSYSWRIAYNRNQKNHSHFSVFTSRKNVGFSPRFYSVQALETELSKKYPRLTAAVLQKAAMIT